MTPEPANSMDASRRYEVGLTIGPCSEGEASELAEAILDLGEAKTVGAGAVSVKELDWTGEGGRSNSSREYLYLVGEVERIIRDSVHSLISGQANSVARTIMSNLAHKHGMRLCDD